MEVAGAEEALSVLNYSLSHIKWRLKPPAKRRLEIDVLALCTEMRPVIMVDYGGMMPELQERLCALLRFCQQESPIFEHLRVMVIEDMIYLIHFRALAEYVKSSLNSEVELVLVNLEQDPLKMVSLAEKCSLVADLIRVQNLFSVSFPLIETNNELSSCRTIDSTARANAESSSDKTLTSQSSGIIDLSSCMQDTQITVPTLNGWLLGYPVVYLFGKEQISDSIYNLSTKYLNIFRILVRNVSSKKGSRLEELMSFSVPYELSMGGSKEPWAEAFMGKMQSRWENCKQVWKVLQLEVSECYPQAIVL
ncbi:uncharacterized protein [Euphorbia lathyris]|uniref:uncharacterized protein n=1 Tax=Euphorbia lathyris TaxID=212925 RepID=UPI003313BF3E